MYAWPFACCLNEWVHAPSPLWQEAVCGFAGAGRVGHVAVAGDRRGLDETAGFPPVRAARDELCLSVLPRTEVVAVCEVRKEADEAVLHRSGRSEVSKVTEQAHQLSEALAATGS
jgi:hypothetical protein